MTIGERIRILRKDNDLFQEDLAKKIGVSRQAVASWEADRTLPSVKNAYAMADVFGCDINDIAGEDMQERRKVHNDEATVLELGGWKTTNIFKNTYRYALPENVDKAKQDATNLIKDLI